MHSSALIDGLIFVARLQQPNDFGSVAAHIAIGFTGQRHRHSGVVRLTGHRQRMACPDCKRCVQNGPHNLHQRIRPRRGLSGQDGESRARFLIRYAASNGPLPDDRFTERRSIVGPSLSRHPQTSCNRNAAWRHFRCHSFSRQAATRRASNMRPDRATAHTIRASLFARATTTTLRFARSSNARSQLPRRVSLFAKLGNAERAPWISKMRK